MKRLMCIIGIGLISMNAWAVPPTSISARLVKWRNGPGQPLVGAQQITFAYLDTPVITVIDRLHPADNSTNNQGDMWSDMAIELSYTGYTRDVINTSWGILIYTSNAPLSPTDPLNGVSLPGGLVGGAGGPPNDPNRSSVLPLLWKWVPATNLTDSSGANINGSVKINNTMFMPTEITEPNGGVCPAGELYPVATRLNNGFCDFSTHYMMDVNTTDPNNLWFANPAVINRKGAFDYATIFGYLGPAQRETGIPFSGTFFTANPAYYLIGVKATQALPTQYATTIYIELFNF